MLITTQVKSSRLQSPWPNKFASYFWEIMVTGVLDPLLITACLFVLYAFMYMGYGAIGTALSTLVLYINRRRVITRADKVLTGPPNRKRERTEWMVTSLRSALAKD